MLTKAISITNLTKIYQIYDKPTDRFKESMSFTNKKYHKDFFALSNITFDVTEGETIGIIGTNGAGKSTLLKIITGVLTPTSGDIEIKGKISALLELGAGFNLEYTGYENIFLNGTILGLSNREIESKIDTILDFADIGDFIYQPVKMYSSGMFARLAFSVAINVNPDILIVDEALSVGDAFFQNKCFKKLDELKDNGTTIIFVSHDIGSIKKLCSRVLWIEKGKQMMFGDKDKVCSEYINQRLKENNELKEQLVNSCVGNNVIIEKAENSKCFFPRLKIPVGALVSTEIEISSFFITDVSGNRTVYLEADHTYNFHLIAEAHQDLNNLIFGFVWENNKGFELFAVNTFMKDYKRLEVTNESVIEVIFELKLPLIKRGEYLLSPAIARGTQEDHTMLVWLSNVVKIFIENQNGNLSLIELESDVKSCKHEMNDIAYVEGD